MQTDTYNCMKVKSFLRREIAMCLGNGKNAALISSQIIVPLIMSCL